MVDVLLWLLAVEVLGLAALPVAYALFPYLVDRGYALSKPLGILLLTYIIWLLGSLHLVPATPWTILGVLLLMAVGSGVLLRSRWGGFVAFLRASRGTILVTEALFLLLYFAWVAYRAYDPSIGHTEQLMDFAFLNASLEARFFPPEDPWLLGHPVSYYYFGYLMMATLTEVTGISPAITYNLALALVPALAGVAVFSLMVTLVRPAVSLWMKRSLEAWVFGALAVALLLVVSNLLGVFELAHSWGLGSPGFWQWLQVKGLEEPATAVSWAPQGHWWWWHSSRVIDTLVDGQSLDYTITEFPFFSFLLGDLHPHVMSLPFILLVLGFCLSVVRDPTMGGAPCTLRRLPFLVAFALALGALGFLNSWDLPTLALVAVGAVLLRLRAADPAASFLRIAVRSLPMVGVLLSLAWLLYLPFYAGFQSQASGVLPVEGPVTRYIHFLIIWAPFLIPVVFLVVAHLVRLLREDRRLSSTALVSLGIVVTPFTLWALAMLLLNRAEAIPSRFLQLVPLLLFLWAALYGLLEGTRRTTSLSLLAALGLALVGGLLLMAPELFYVVDVFNNRMNTMFKVYYQAWALFSVASAFALYAWVDMMGRASPGWRIFHYGGLALSVLLLIGSLYYPLTASYSKAQGFQGTATLDGLAHLEREVPGERGAIEWLRESAPSGARLVEVVGDDYTAYGRISASTGIPTLVNWLGHELQWRGSSKPMDGRREAVDSIYGSADVEEVERLLAQYDIRYVVVGRREVSQYGEPSMEKFASFMVNVFSEGEVVIYQRRTMEQGE